MMKKAFDFDKAVEKTESLIELSFGIIFLVMLIALTLFLMGFVVAIGLGVFGVPVP